MKYKKIILAGGNGYLGRVLADYYRQLTDEVIILSRRDKADDENIRTVFWDGRTEGEWKGCLDCADMLINLCGKNVNCRYTCKLPPKQYNLKVEKSTKFKLYKNEKKQIQPRTN